MTFRRLGLAFTLAFVPANLFAAASTPDAFGYTWADNNEPGVTSDIPTILGRTDLTLGADEVSAPIDIGFSFPFYGQNYTQLVISSNGWISFDTTLTNSQPVPQALPAASNPNRTLGWFWRDLDAPLAGFSFYGPATNAFYIRMVTQTPGQPPLTGNIVLSIVLYRSGVIKVVYDGVEEADTVSIGIEDAPGAVGHNPAYLGSTQFGFTLASGTTIMYFPPAQLNCSAPGAITCGQTRTFSSPATVNPNVSSYLCSSGSFLGRENVIQFANPGLNDVTVTLTPPGTRDMDVFLLRQDACNEFQCIDTGDTSFTHPFLPTGNYYLVVDGKLATDVGTFDLTVSCTPKSATQNCGATPVRGTLTGTSVFNNYPCSNRNYDGPEFIYEVPFTAPGNLKVSFTPDPGAALSVIAFGPDNFDAPGGCIGAGDNSLILFNPASGRYYFMVDGYTPDPADGRVNTGGYSFSVSCDIALSCAAPAGDLICGQVTNGSTVGATNRAELYSCGAALHDGPEVVYRFRNDAVRTVAFKYTGPPDLGMFLIDATCNEGACSRFGSAQSGRLVARNLPIGDYFVVVDGRNGASGAFSLKPICANKVDPNSGGWTMNPGDKIHEVKALTITGEPTYGDVMFSVDITGSMGGTIANLQTTTQNIITQLAAQVDDVEFALSWLQDYPAPGTGTNCAGTSHDPSDRPYFLTLPMTGNLAELFQAIQTLAARGGGDGPESYLTAFWEMMADAGNIGWRNGARQIVVMMGDNDAHSCDAFACTQGRALTGSELGPDGNPGTTDDIPVLPLMDDLRTAGITPFFFQTSNNLGLFNQWDCWTKRGGGRAYDAPDGLLPPGVVLDLRRTIESRTLICYDITVATDPGYETWLTNLTPAAMKDVYLPAEVTFDLDVGPPAGTTPGIYNFKINFICDGEVKAFQTVQVEVPGVCQPQALATLSGRTCPGDARTLDASASSILRCDAPAFVEWQWKDSLGNVVQPWDRNGQVLVVAPTASTSYTVEIRCSDPVACPFEGSRTIQVDVDPSPPADAGPDLQVCLTQSIQIGTPPQAGLNYSWSPSTELNDPFLSDPTFSTSASSPLGPRVYTVTVTDPASGCQSTDTMTIDVTSGAPVGRIANNLLAGKRFPDVDLYWRGGPLSIRNYNVHREQSKLNLSPPGLPIGQASGDEFYTDAGAVTVPTLLFYQVYGRDCAGNSIFN